MADANMIVKQYLGCEPDNIDVNAADINNDGSITIADANLLHNYFLGRIVNIKLNKTSLDLMVGSSETLTAEFSQMTPTDNPCTWSTSDTSIATVDNNGKVTAIKGGTAIIVYIGCINPTFTFLTFFKKVLTEKQRVRSPKRSKVQCRTQRIEFFVVTLHA